MPTPMFPTALYKHRGKAADQSLSLDEWNQVGLEVQALEKTMNEALGNPANEPGDNVVSPPWSLTVSALTWGKQTIKGRLVDADDASDIQVRTNWKNISPIAKDDIAYAGWMMRLGGVIDEFSIWRADTAIPSVATMLLKVSTTGKLTTKGGVQAGGSVTPVAAEGWSALVPGNATTNPGYVAFHIQDGTRRGYVGWKSPTASNHLTLTADGGCAGWEINIPASDDGLRIQGGAQPTILFDTSARAGMWFGNTSNSRWYFGHQDNGGAGMGLRMFRENAPAGDHFIFYYNGDLYAKQFWRGLSQYTWLYGLAQNTADGEVQVSLTGIAADPGGMASGSSSLIFAPANCIILLGASMTIAGNGHAVSIKQWDGSTWHTRAAQSGPSTGFISAISCFAMCNTIGTSGTIFGVFVSSGGVAPIVVGDSSPHFWGIVLGRAS